jgi:hypothetical protein
MFLFYSTVPIILKVDHYPTVSNSWLPCFLFQSSCSIISDMRRDYAEPLTPDLRHVGRSNPYLCLPWEGLCTSIPLASPSYNTTNFSQTCGYLCFLSNSYIIRCALNWTDESKLWAYAGRLDVLCRFCGHSNWPRHLLIQVLPFSSSAVYEYS